MKNKQLFTLLNSLIKLKDLKGVKFAYAIAKNKKKFLAEAECIQEAIAKLTPEMQKIDKEYERKRITLAEKCSKKDKDGHAISLQGSYAIENKPMWEVEFEKLKKGYKDLIAAREEAEKANEELLEKECTVDIHKIQEADLPEDISVEQLEIISELITQLKEI